VSRTASSHTSLSIGHSGFGMECGAQKAHAHAQIDQLTERSLAAGLEMDVPREHAAKVAELGMAIEMRPADAAADEAAAEAPTVQDRVAAAHGDRADGAPQGDSAAAGADAAPQDGAAEGGAAEAQPAGEEDEAEQGAGGDEEGEGGDEEAAEKPVIILRMAPYDPRFPSTNQVGRARPQGVHQAASAWFIAVQSDMCCAVAVTSP